MAKKVKKDPVAPVAAEEAGPALPADEAPEAVTVDPVVPEVDVEPAAIEEAVAPAKEDVITPVPPSLVDVDGVGYTIRYRGRANRVWACVECGHNHMPDQFTACAKCGEPFAPPAQA